MASKAVFTAKVEVQPSKFQRPRDLESGFNVEVRLFSKKHVHAIKKSVKFTSSRPPFYIYFTKESIDEKFVNN